MAKVDGGLLVARALAAEGIEYVATLCGGHINRILYGCRRLGIRILDTRHEEAAVHMAAGWAEVTGRPSAAVVTAGPGVTNAFSALARADGADCPILVLGGECTTGVRQLGAPQELDTSRVMEPVTRWARSVDETRRIPEFMASAFRHMLNGRTGPAFLSIPADVLAREVDEEEIVSVTRSEPSKQCRYR